MPTIPAPDAADPLPEPPRRGSWSIATVLALTFGGLVGLAVAAVVAVNLWIGRDTTLQLLRDKGELLVSNIEGRMAEQLDPAATQLEFVAELLSRPGGPGDDRARIADLLTGALAATPQILRVTFIDETFHAVAAQRTPGRDEVEIRYVDQSQSGPVRDAVAFASQRIGGWWADLIYDRFLNMTLVNRRHSVWRQGRFVGQLVAFVSVRQLSGFLVTAQRDGVGNGFILRDREFVLAHPNLTRESPIQLSPERPLPRIGEIGDPVLAAIWDRPVSPPLLGTGTGFHMIDLPGGERYLFLHRTLYRYGDKPLVVGTWLRAAEAVGELRQLALAAGVGIGILLLSVAAAAWFGRRIARPIRRLSLAASRVRDLEFASMPDLAGSRLRELDEQARAFNAMLAGLRWFESYVPRALVRRLVRRYRGDDLPSVERELTVMFTDIVGFTAVSERMSAADTAALLNHHFAMVTAAIEAQGGTLDKFIGDGAMAFWGAPSRQPDHAARAARAARGIARAVHADNADRRRRGLAPIRVRVGIHTGPVIVGNIGAPGRVNYTIVGDTVNTAQRIEQLARDLPDEESDVTVLVSGFTAARLGSDFDCRPAGRFTLRGRAELVPVFRLAASERTPEPAARHEAAAPAR